MEDGLGNERQAANRTSEGHSYFLKDEKKGYARSFLLLHTASRLFPSSVAPELKLEDCLST